MNHPSAWHPLWCRNCSGPSGGSAERGLTVILVEQNVAASLKFASRAYVLKNGRIVTSGTGAALLSDARVRQAYLGIG